MIGKRILLGAIAVGLSLIALYMTTAFYSTYGRNPTEAAVFVALAVLSMAIKLAAPSGAAMMRGHIVVQIALWLGFAAALCFDALGTGGYIEMTYGAKSGAVTQEAKDYKDAEGRRDSARRALEEYSDAKGSITEAELALKSAKVEAGNCKSRAFTDVCRAVASAEAILARVTERDRRASVLANAQSKLDTLNEPTAADDAQAAILTKLGSRIGWEGLGNFVVLIISVLIFLFFEIVAPAMSFAALHGSSSKTAQKPPEHRAKPPDTGRVASSRRARTAKGSTDAVLVLLSDLVTGSRSAPGIVVSGRKICGAQRALGQACALSGAAVNRHLAALKDAGTIALSAGPAGTEIELL